VLFSPDDESQLVSVRAVDRDWPLRGEVQVRSDPEPERLERGPMPGEAWGDGALLLSLELEPGNPVELGYLTLDLAAEILVEPDRGSNLFDIAPRLLIHFEDLERTGLIGPGSRVRYEFLAAGPPAAVEALRDRLKPRWSRVSA
jgi:putative ABC transport system permease protein